MSKYFGSDNCPCLASLISTTICSFVNDKISIDFTVGNFDNETLQEDYPGLDLDKQQFYIFKPSESFDSMVDSLVTKQSNARNNLQCSYELFDEHSTSDGLDDGYFNTSDSFACKYDPEKVKEGLFDSSDSTPFSLYSSKMPLEYKNQRILTNGTFRYLFDVGNNAGTYCLNVTIYDLFQKPVIKFWDRTPLSKKQPQLSLPNHDLLSWIGITSVCLVVFGILDLFYQDRCMSTFLILICLIDNAFQTMAISSDADKTTYFMSLFSLLGMAFGVPIMLLVSITIIVFVSLDEKTYSVFAPFIITRLYRFVANFVHTFTRNHIAYSPIGSVVNDLVFYKYNDKQQFWGFVALNIVAWGVSIIVAIASLSDVKRKAAIAISLLTLYLITCVLIEVSFLTKKSEFLDIYYKDSLVIIYSRLHEFLIIAYICGNTIWKLFDQHYQFYQARFSTGASSE